MIFGFLWMEDKMRVFGALIGIALLSGCAASQADHAGIQNTLTGQGMENIQTTPGNAITCPYIGSAVNFTANWRHSGQPVSGKVCRGKGLKTVDVVMFD